MARKNHKGLTNHVYPHYFYLYPSSEMMSLLYADRKSSLQHSYDTN